MRRFQMIGMVFGMLWAGIDLTAAWAMGEDDRSRSPRVVSGPVGDLFSGDSEGMWIAFFGPAPSPSSSSEGRKESPLSKIPPRPLPPAMLAAVIPSRSDSPTPTRPVRLADLLRQPAPRNQQLEIILAYWDLAAAVATVQFRKEERTRLQNLRVFAADQQAYQTALGQAETALQAAETALAAAQRRLADKMGWDSKAAPPWPVDKPHIGPYWTQLASLFSGRTAPRPLRLIDRCLPWWQKTIDRRAEAIYAAQDALDAFTEAYHQGRTDLRQVLWAHARWTEQHTAFLQATLAYNAQIAEFALTVAPAQTQGASLVSMLILTNDRSQGTAGNRQTDARGASWPTPQQSPWTEDSGVQPAGYEEPAAPAVIPAPQPEPLSQPASQGTAGAKQEPTLAPPRELPGSESSARLTPGRQEPTLAPPKESSPAAKPTEPIPSSSPLSSIPLKAPESSPLRPLVPIAEPGGPSTPTPASSAASETSKNTAGEQPKIAPEKPVPYETKRPPGLGNSFSEESVALYPALARASPSAQVKQLALSFHGPINPSEKVRQETLLACLQRVPAGQRRELIEAYWMLWQQWAELAALAQQRELLDDLGRSTLQQRNRPLGAEMMLQWRATQLAEDADRMEARIRLLEREEKLAQYLDVSAEGTLTPVTLPHTGPYQLRLEAQPKKVAESWPVRRAAGLIPALYTSLQDQAKAVVLADQTRSELLYQYRQGQRSLQEVLAACDQQKQAALEFLQTLTDYNQAIADYVVLVAPAALPAERFVQTLVTDK